MKAYYTDTRGQERHCGGGQLEAENFIAEELENNAVFVGVNTRNKSAGDFMNSASEQLKSVQLLSLENNAATYNL